MAGEDRDDGKTDIGAACRKDAYNLERGSMSNDWPDEALN
jgi:hypothetical protein